MVTNALPQAHRRSFRVSTASGLFYNNNSRLPNTHRCYCRAAKGSPHTKTPPNPNVESTVVDTQASFSERLAKRIARSGLCSRRTAEEWIRNGRVKVDGVTTMSLSVNVNASNVVQVDDQVVCSALLETLASSNTRLFSDFYTQTQVVHIQQKG